MDINDNRWYLDSVEYVRPDTRNIIYQTIRRTIMNIVYIDVDNHIHYE